jgi:hypothetical protein
VRAIPWGATRTPAAGARAAAGGTGGIGGTGGNGGTGGALAPSMACRSPEPVVYDGLDIGFVTCEGGWDHRVRAVECRPFAERPGETCNPDELGGTCRADADCVDKPYGRCQYGDWEGSGCTCKYGCLRDADCDDGQLCRCSGEGGTCMPAECRSAADCGEGALCATYWKNPWCGETGYACQTSADECMGDAECADSNGACAYDEGYRGCYGGGCVIGRPFLVDGEARTAPVCGTDAWLDADLTLPTRPSDPRVARRLALWFAEAGRFEHASVAAFARFSLELLAFGAPPALLSAAQQAMIDETAHARTCFTLASHYAGEAIGPGPLSLTGALTAPSLAETVAAAVVEGCVGETLAALEAAEAAADASEPALRAAFERIAADERRHAELAWAFVRWAVDAGGDAVRECARAAFEGELARVRREADPEDAALTAAGIPAGAVRTATRRSACAQVVGPVAAALLAA